MSFRVELDTYRGPLDLLLYLVRKHELDSTDLSVSRILDQYLEHLSVLEQLDVDAVGDFLELASTLIEIKSRMVLPRMDEDDEPVEDPREELVERLLAYKKYKDAASILEERSRRQQKSYVRLASDLPARRVLPADRPIHEVELWDLVSAMGRLLRQSQTPREATIVYDETPIGVHMQGIHQRVAERGRMAFSETLMPGMHKSVLIGVFLAVLELVRHHHVEAEQDEGRGEIWITPGPRFHDLLELTDEGDYDRRPSAGATAS
jgi:segregation and condensation protein A